MKTVLVISRYFPPGFEVGGKRAWRFAKYLPRHDWRAVVVTDRVEPDAPADPSLVIPEHVEVVREFTPAWWWRPPCSESDGTVATPIERAAPPSPKLLPRIARQLRLPLGKDALLAPRFAHLARKLARRTGAAALLATSSPPAALLFGVAARRATGLPLCLDLRDPWSLNFYQRDLPRWVRRAEQMLEGRLLAAADRVTFTSESAAEAYRALYPSIPRDRIRCITNSFDPELRPTPAPRSDDHFTIVHFGNVYGRRTLAPVLHALRGLKQRGVPGTERIRVDNLGRITRQDLELAAHLGVDDQLSSRAFLPYEQGLRVLASANLQLLLGYADETLFVPAKLYDYLMTGRPILCVAPASELTRIVAETGAGTSCHPADVPGIEDALERALARTLTARSALEAPALARYSAPETARQLAALLDDMTAEARRGPRARAATAVTP